MPGRNSPEYAAFYPALPLNLIYGINTAGFIMAAEIELKAHVRDSEAMRLMLDKKAEYRGSFEKEDSYWYSGGPSDLPPSGLRIRREKFTFPDGSAKSSVFATFKTKELREGIEINDEQEFEVNPPQAFEEFLGRMGLTQGASKRKKGWAYSYKGINAELAEVEGLGWFMELEIIADNSREETVAEGRKRLLGFLACLGIERDAIESRFYTEMLAGAKAT